ncbi:MAG: hypothetical protein KIT84_24510 [Labilithrix sp.]|nr:hypothetical protein [Labilithrix sp.]MCW5814212.1 hypothetical protein [Labilithrix sp.]
MKRTNVAVLCLVLGSLGVVGAADAQPRPGAPEHRAPSTWGTSSGSSSKSTLSSQARTPINDATKRELTRRLTTSYEHMPADKKQALARSTWGLYQAIRDPGPVPHVTPGPPVDPPKPAACTDCGTRQAYPADPCQGLRDELKEIMRQQILKGVIVNQLQSVLQALADMAFYGGVADLVANVVTTTAGLVTAGAGGALGKAAVNVLKGIAMDQIKSAITDALAGALPAPLDSAVSGNLTEAGLNGIISALTSQISALNAQKVAKINALNACAASYSASLKTIDANNAKVVDCMSKTPNYCL